MNDDLQKLKDIYLAEDVDSEDYKDNLRDITEMEKSIIENENLLGWQEHDLTKKVVEMARRGYIDIATRLATTRDLTEGERLSLFAKQDAMKWLISIADGEPKLILEKIDSDVKKALRSV